MRFRPYPVPEFPTDNHAIHLGASWICLSTTAAPRAVRRPSSFQAQAEHVEHIQLTPLPASVAEAPESRFVSSPLPPSVSNIPVPPASLLQSLLGATAGSTPGSFAVQVPNAHLLSDLARPRRSDEYHVDDVPGPLLSQLVVRLESELPLSQLALHNDFLYGNAASDDLQLELQPLELLEHQPPSSELKSIEQGVEGLALTELTILEADASVPPPVAELLESLPITSARLHEADAAIDAELFEVLSALKQLDQEDTPCNSSGLSSAAMRQRERTDSAASDSAASDSAASDSAASHSDHPESGVQRAGEVQEASSAAPRSLDDLANAIADALCAEYAPAASEPAVDPARSWPEQRAVAPELKYPQLAREQRVQLDNAEVQGADAQRPGAEHTGDEQALHIRTAAQADQFANFVSALADVAMSSGQSRAAAVLPRLLAGKLLDYSALAEDVIDRLAGQNIAMPRGSCVEPTPAFIASASAWGELLRGQSDDMSSCGDTLDHFAANLLCALMGEGADHQAVRRELRKRGVAAFGMLKRAA